MIMERLKVGNTKLEDIDMLEQVTKQIEGHAICALGDAAAWPAHGFIRYFRPVQGPVILSWILHGLNIFKSPRVF